VKEEGLPNLKLIGGSALFALLLAVLSGVFGKVAPGALAIRALISALVFAGVVTGLSAVIKKYLPELLELQILKGKGSPKVDIVLEDEYPTTDGAAVFEENPEADEAVASSASDHIENESGGGTAQETEEIHEQKAPEKREPASDSSDEVEELDAIENSDSADEMPSLDRFSESFAPENSTFSPSDEVTQIMGDDVDPKDLAKAVQTILNRDEEG